MSLFRKKTELPRNDLPALCTLNISILPLRKKEPQVYITIFFTKARFRIFFLQALSIKLEFFREYHIYTFTFASLYIAHSSWRKLNVIFFYFLLFCNHPLRVDARCHLLYIVFLHILYNITFNKRLRNS